MATLSRRTVLAAAALALPAVARADTAGDSLVAAARTQLGLTTGYDSGYRRIAYPGGDAPRTTGVCADVVVRAARDAWGADLQQLVHEDMARAFAAYPSRRVWGLPHPDSNIDHRRVLNLETYWTRQNARLWLAPKGTLGFTFGGEVEPGDLLTWRLMGRLPHVGIVASGGLAPTVIHNIGGGVEVWPLAAFAPHLAGGRYRWRPAARV